MMKWSFFTAWLLDSLNKLLESMRRSSASGVGLEWQLGSGGAYGFDWSGCLDCIGIQHPGFVLTPVLTDVCRSCWYPMQFSHSYCQAAMPKFSALMSQETFLAPTCFCSSLLPASFLLLLTPAVPLSLTLNPKP